MPDKPRRPTYPENFVVNHAASNYVVNFVVNLLEPLRSVAWNRTGRANVHVSRARCGCVCSARSDGARSDEDRRWPLRACHPPNLC